MDSMESPSIMYKYFWSFKYTGKTFILPFLQIEACNLNLGPLSVPLLSPEGLSDMSLVHIFQACFVWIHDSTKNKLFQKRHHTAQITLQLAFPHSTLHFWDLFLYHKVSTWYISFNYSGSVFPTFLSPTGRKIFFIVTQFTLVNMQNWNRSLTRQLPSLCGALCYCLFFVSHCVTTH